MDIATLLATDSILFKLIMALFLGAFIGLRRQMDIQQEGSESFVGFRTMPLIVMLGALSTMIPEIPLLPVICLVGVLVFLAIAYYNGVFKLQLIGLTSEFATLIMFLVGVLVGSGEYITAIVLTVVIALLTGFKSQLHKFAQNISPQEWGGALQLLILSAVVLPFLPREAVDPWGVLVPFDIWLLVIFISGIGFIGYFLQKYIDSKKSLLATSVLGSLVSSTAVTTALALKSKNRPEIPKQLFILALLVAVATMLVRTILSIMVIAPSSVKIVVLVPIAMLTACIFGIIFYSKADDEIEVELRPDLESPFELLPALKFGALFVIVLIAVEIGKNYLGDYGVLITAFFSAFVDVDATMLSSMQASRLGNITTVLAIQAITVAIIINTLVKVGYVWLLGRRDVAKFNTVIISLVSLVGVLTFVLL